MLPRWFTVALVANTFTGISGAIVSAQVIPDGSVGTIVTECNTGTCRVTGGQLGNGTLFHSFDQFSWGQSTGIQRVVFDGTGLAAPIQSLFARVTGTLPSAIDGVLQTTGQLQGADFFLINPQGVIFGPNARLDVGGSLWVSSGDGVVFANNQVFSSRTLAFPDSLLRVSVPLGLQLGQANGSITLQGPGNHASGGPTSITTVTPHGGLRVATGKTLGLVGGTIASTGAALQAPQGRIVLMAAGGAGTVPLVPLDNGWTIAPPLNLPLQSITLSNGTLVNGDQGISLWASDLSLTDRSCLLAQSQDFPHNAGLNLTLSDRLQLNSNAAILSETLGTTPGNPISIQAQTLLLDGDARISSLTVGRGQAGNVDLKATAAVQIAGKTPSIAPNSTHIRSTTLGIGDAGIITIVTPHLTLNNAGVITSSTVNPATGNAGEIHIAAQDVEVTGMEPISLLPSAIRSASLSAGHAGLVKIESDRIRVTDGGRITALTASSGDAGEIQLQATESIEVTGTSASLSPSLISVGTNTLAPVNRKAYNLPDVPSGNAGTLSLKAPRLWVSQGGQITATNQGSGNSGNLVIQVNQLTLNTGGEISALANGESGGVAGNIQIQTDRLLLSQGSLVATSRLGQGGNIDLSLNDRLVMQQNSLISTASGTLQSGGGNGGNITISAPFILSLPHNNSDIIANAFQGSGGNIQLTGSGIYGLTFGNAQDPRRDDRNNVTASSRFGVSGNTQVNQALDPSPGLAVLLDTVKSPELPIVLDLCKASQGNTFIVNGMDTIPPSARQVLAPEILWQDDRPGKVALSPPPPLIPSPLREALSWRKTPTGQILLSHDTTQFRPDPSGAAVPCIKLQP